MQAIPPKIEPAKRKSVADKTEATTETLSDSAEDAEAKADTGKGKPRTSTAAGNG
jgi:hypothetical protein